MPGTSCKPITGPVNRVNPVLAYPVQGDVSVDWHSRHGGTRGLLQLHEGVHARVHCFRPWSRCLSVRHISATSAGPWWSTLTRARQAPGEARGTLASCQVEPSMHSALQACRAIDPAIIRQFDHDLYSLNKRALYYGKACILPSSRPRTRTNTCPVSALQTCQGNSSGTLKWKPSGARQMVCQMHLHSARDSR